MGRWGGRGCAAGGNHQGSTPKAGCARPSRRRATAPRRSVEPRRTAHRPGTIPIRMPNLVSPVSARAPSRADAGREVLIHGVARAAARPAGVPDDPVAIVPAPGPGPMIRPAAATFTPLIPPAHASASGSRRGEARRAAHPQGCPGARASPHRAQVLPIQPLTGRDNVPAGLARCGGGSPAPPPHRAAPPQGRTPHPSRSPRPRR